VAKKQNPFRHEALKLNPSKAESYNLGPKMATLEIFNKILCLKTAYEDKIFIKLVSMILNLV